MTMLAQLPERIRETEAKINGFQQLPQGWHYGSGMAPNTQVIALAQDLNLELANIGFSKTNAFPGVDGEIQVTGYFDTLYVELTIETDLSITYLLERSRIEVEYAAQLSLAETLQKLHTLRGMVWALSGSLMQSTTTKMTIHSKASHSSRPVMVVGSLSLTKNVLFKQASPSVPTLQRSTPKPPELERFSGK